MREASPIRSILFILALALLVPTALADEATSDCEADQPWIGYRSTMAVRDAARGATAGIASLEVCEGEQWDGQDAVQPDQNTACPGPSAYLDPRDLLVGFCSAPDPNVGPGSDPLYPARARVSSADLREAYISANAAFVGRVALYAGTCAAGEEGLEGEASCRGTRELRTGLYVRDDTVGNAVTHTIACLGRIICHPPMETDCSHAVYMHGAMTGQQLCSRDNTAFGIGLVLP